VEGCLIKVGSSPRQRSWGGGWRVLLLAVEGKLCHQLVRLSVMCSILCLPDRICFPKSSSSTISTSSSHLSLHCFEIHNYHGRTEQLKQRHQSSMGLVVHGEVVSGDGIIRERPPSERLWVSNGSIGECREHAFGGRTIRDASRAYKYGYPVLHMVLSSCNTGVGTHSSHGCHRVKL
jgi:hypothetical protein